MFYPIMTIIRSNKGPSSFHVLKTWELWYIFLLKFGHFTIFVTILVIIGYFSLYPVIFVKSGKKDFRKHDYFKNQKHN